MMGFAGVGVALGHGVGDGGAGGGADEGADDGFGGGAVVGFLGGVHDVGWGLRRGLLLDAAGGGGGCGGGGGQAAVVFCGRPGDGGAGLGAADGGRLACGGDAGGFGDDGAGGGGGRVLEQREGRPAHFRPCGREPRPVDGFDAVAVKVDDGGAVVARVRVAGLGLAVDFAAGFEGADEEGADGVFGGGGEGDVRGAGGDSVVVSWRS